MTTLTTFTVYTLTPRGSYSYKYEGTDREAAQKAYNKLEAADKPRGMVQQHNAPYGMSEDIARVGLPK